MNTETINEINLENVEFMMEAGYTYQEAVQALADMNGNGWNVENVEYTLQCHRDALEYSKMCDEQSDEDAQAEYEFEMASEGAWLRQAEYDPEAQDEMHRDDMRGGY